MTNSNDVVDPFGGAFKSEDLYTDSSSGGSFSYETTDTADAWSERERGIKGSREKERAKKQRKVVERMIQCVAKRLAEANITILEDAREDLERLMSIHKLLSRNRSLDQKDREWIEDRFYYYKEMDT